MNSNLHEQEKCIKELFANTSDISHDSSSVTDSSRSVSGSQY